MKSGLKTEAETGSAKIKTEEPPALERRSFFEIAIGLIASAITAVLGITIGRYTIAPALSAISAEQWIDVGLLEEIPENQPVKRSVVISQDAGWGRFNSQRLVWVIKKGAEVRVFSAVCPHLGCTVNEAASGFICPCHGSAWNAEGKRLGGPAPQDLDALEHRIQGELLQVKYQHFKPGIAKKEALI